MTEIDTIIKALDDMTNDRLATIEKWQRVGDAIMLCATGKAAPLSDSDVCGVIAELRAQVAELWTQLTERDAHLAGWMHVVDQRNAQIAELQAKVAKCKCTDDFGNVAE
jgi:hypothetical protein